MTGQAPWPERPVPPQGLDVTVPNVARIYDYLLGGKDNFEADREAARRLLVAVPGAARAARANRTFLARAVQFLGREAGIRQFLLANSLTVAATHADLRQPDHLFTMPVTRSLLDTSQPLAVLLVAVLLFLPDDDNPWTLVDQIKHKLAPGSYVVISHVTADEIPFGAARQAAEVYRHASAPGVARSRDDIARFFSGLDMVAPGLVDVATWRTPPPGWPAAPGPVLRRHRPQAPATPQAPGRCLRLHDPARSSGLMMTPARAVARPQAARAGSTQEARIASPGSGVS